MKVTITGLSEFANDLRKHQKNVLNNVALDILKIAKDLVPVSTGKLRDSIQILEDSENSKIIGSDVEYSGFVEFGTKDQAPQPFIRPALYKIINDYK